MDYVQSYFLLIISIVTLNTPFSSSMLTSLFFVLSHHALESALTPGSVAYNIILSPFLAFLCLY